MNSPSDAWKASCAITLATAQEEDSHRCRHPDMHRAVSVAAKADGVALSYEGLYPHEVLHTAIAEGDAPKIREHLLHLVEQKLGDKLESAVIHARERGDEKKLADIMRLCAASVNPSADSLYGNPESLLQRAWRAEQPESFQAILNIARMDPVECEKLIATQRLPELDGNTVLHDLAASIPRKYQLETRPGKPVWDPKALLHDLLSTLANKDTAVIVNANNQTAGDLAQNGQVHDKLKTLEHQAETEFTSRWAKRNAGNKSFLQREQATAKRTQEL